MIQMATQSEKEQVIRTSYYDVDDGFDNAKQPMKKSKKALPSTTLDDVKAFLAKQTIQHKKRLSWF